MIQKYENIIETKKKGIINMAFHQGKVFKKFKDKEKFITLVSRLGIHKNTIIFKINVFKLCERYPKLLKSSILKIIIKTLKQSAWKMHRSFHNHLLFF